MSYLELLERYRVEINYKSKYELKPFNEVCTLKYGASLPKNKRIPGEYPVVGSNGITGYHNEFLIDGPSIIVGRKGSAGEVVFIEKPCFPIDTTYYIKLLSPEKCDLKYLYHILLTLDLPSLKGGAGIPGLNRNDVYERFKIPFPPLEIQKEIVAEIEAYQKIIDGARQVVENYKPQIQIDPDWPMMELGEVLRIKGGYAFKSSDFINKGIQVIKMGNVKKMYFDINNNPSFLPKQFKFRYRDYILSKGDILISMTGTIGKTDYGNVCMIDIEGDFLLNQRVGKFQFKTKEINKKFIYFLSNQDFFTESLFKNSTGGIRQANISSKQI